MFQNFYSKNIVSITLKFILAIIGSFLLLYNNSSLSKVPKRGASELIKNLFERQTISLQPKLTKSETLVVGPSNLF